MRAVAVLLLGVCLGWTSDLSGRRAPGFALPDPEYKHFYDPQDYRGKVLVIDFMSTGCPHCMLLTSTLEGIKQKFGDRVAILSIVLPPDNQATVAKYIEKNRVTVPIVCDQGQVAISYFNARPGQEHIDVPHLFLVDKNGMIRADFGYEESNRAVFEGPGLEREIEKLLR